MNEMNDLPFGLLILILLAGLGIGLLSLTERHKATLRFQARLYLLALAVRFFFTLLIYEIGLIGVLGDEDASGWYFGVLQMQEWDRRDISILDLPLVLTDAFKGQHRGYGYLLGVLFYLTGAPGRISAAALNCFFGAITVVFAYRIARSLFPERVAIWTGWMTCLAPSLIIWSSQTVKEPVVIMIEVIALYCCVQLKFNGFSMRYLVFCGLAVITVMPFRFYAAYLVGGAVLLSLIIPQFGKRKITVGSGLLFGAIIISLIVGTGIFAQHEAQFQSFDVERIATFRRNVSEGSTGARSGVKMDYDMKTPTGFATGTLIGSVYFLLAPFPWQLTGGSTRMLLTAPEVFVWWWLFFIGIIPGLWWLLRNRFSDIQPLLFFTFGMLLLYSAMFGNVGLAYRQRAQLLPFLLIFAAVGIELRRQRKLARLEQRMRLHTPAVVGVRQ
jgi:4-amino-4-deoxy-L-arabinose transferase-like glycosyltransferase